VAFATIALKNGKIKFIHQIGEQPLLLLLRILLLILKKTTIDNQYHISSIYLPFDHIAQDPLKVILKYYYCIIYFILRTIGDYDQYLFW